MNRLKKAILLPVRSVACRTHRFRRLYYWSEIRLYELRTVCVMPRWYHHGLYRACMWLVKFRKFRRIAGRMVHTIPYPVRFEVA